MNRLVSVVGLLHRLCGAVLVGSAPLLLDSVSRAGLAANRRCLVLA